MVWKDVEIIMVRNNGWCTNKVTLDDFKDSTTSTSSGSGYNEGYALEVSKIGWWDRLW